MACHLGHVGSYKRLLCICRRHFRRIPGADEVVLPADEANVKRGPLNGPLFTNKPKVYCLLPWLLAAPLLWLLLFPPELLLLVVVLEESAFRERVDPFNC